MDLEKLKQLAEKFAGELETSKTLQEHVADHDRRNQRAQSFLTAQRIPSLTEDELRELLFDSDAFGFWKNKEYEFNNRLQSVGLDGLRQALIELITRAEKGLTPEDLKHVWAMRGLGTLLATELLAYRFPTRYWTYTASVTLPVFKMLGEDIKAGMPSGQKSNAYLYLALEPHLAQVRHALGDAGIAEVDNLLADVFLWWAKQTSETRQAPRVEARRYWKISPGEQGWSWDEFLARDVIAIGWPGVGDLQQVGATSREELRSHFEREGLRSGQSAAHAARQLWMLYGEMKPGDFACAYGKGQVLGWGEITDDYTHKADDFRYPHRRAVRWISTEAISADGLPADLLKKIRQNQTIIELSESEFAQIQNASGVRNVWLFQANPKYFDLAADLERRKVGDRDDWTVTSYRHEMKPGDPVVFWLAGKESGIYAIGELMSEPYQRDLKTDQASFDERPYEKSKWWIDFRYTRILDEPILREELKEHPVLHNLSVLKFANATNFRVTPEEWAAIEQLLEKPAVKEHGITGEVEPIDARATLARSLAASGFHFTDWQIATFYTALQAKHFVILSGVSGTGKTKLAQHFAALLPQPSGIEGVDSEEAITITVQPYMLKYGRLIIPKQATRLFDPPPPGDHTEVNLSFKGFSQTCRFVHAAYDNKDYLSLLLRGSARQWFNNQLQPSDVIRLEPEIDDNQKLTGFRLLTDVEHAEDDSAKSQGQNWLFVPVRPDWRDSKSLLGYYNPLMAAYEWTPFLRFLLRAAQSYRSRDGLAWFVILDEMNLAHVEYYFADLLSVLESGREEEGWTREVLRFGYADEAEGDLPPRELKLPPNVYFVGTVNVDETTHAFSPKVLDRAFTLELTEADFSDYPPDRDENDAQMSGNERLSLLNTFTFDGEFPVVDKQRIADYVSRHTEARDRLQSLNTLLRRFNLHFGYRVFDEIVSFLDAAEANQMFPGERGSQAAFDAAVLMKILPKFHGSRGKLEAPLRAVLAWAANPDAPAEELIANELKRVESGDDIYEALGSISYACRFTAERARRMLRSLYTDGFAAFA